MKKMDSDIYKHFDVKWIFFFHILSVFAHRQKEKKRGGGRKKDDVFNDTL